MKKEDFLLKWTQLICCDMDKELKEDLEKVLNNCNNNTICQYELFNKPEIERV